MKEVYNFIVEKLEKFYRKEKRGIYECYLKGTSIVAVKDKDIINLYFKPRLSHISNHYIVVTIAKDFKIFKLNNKEKQKQYCVKVQDAITVIDCKDESVCGMKRIGNTLLLKDSHYFPLNDEKDISIGCVGKAYRNKTGDIYLDFLEIPYRVKILNGTVWKDIDGLNYNLFQCKRDNLALTESDDIYPILREKYKYLWKKQFNSAESLGLRMKIERTKYRNYHECKDARIYRKVGKCNILIFFNVASYFR